MNCNSVELLGFYGSDVSHACSAWTSTNRDLDDGKINRIPELLKMLASEEHHTPFEKSSLHFLVNVDQATHIHHLKHRVGVSINGESARYKELKEDKMYLPKDWNGNNVDFTNFNAYDDLTFKGIETWKQLLESYTEMGNRMYHECLNQLTPTLGRKRAKESARFFKTMNSQITMDVMFNWRSFAHFQKLRNSKDSQKEVREIAEQMLELVKNIEGNPFKHTIIAFNL
jgi:flavin-dependent thymidylate synthase